MRNAPPPPDAQGQPAAPGESFDPALAVGGRASATAAAALPKSMLKPAEAAPVGDRSRTIRRRLAYAFLIGYSVLMFVPFAWTVVTSFKTLADSVQLTLIPQPFTTAPWEYVFNKLQPSVIQLFFNSFLIAFAVTLSNVVLGSLAGYAFARLRFPGRTLLFLIVLATLMIPDQLRMLPIYVMFNTIGLSKGPLQIGGVILVLAISATK